MSDLLNYLVQHDQNFRRARLPALYSDFRSQRTLNPDGFVANVAAWKQALSSAALAGYAPSKSTTRNHLILDLDSDSLLRSLESKQFGRPLALGTVLQDAIANGEMMSLQQFLKTKESIYYRSWGNIPWSVMSWGLKQVGIGGPGDSLPRGQFVVLQNLDAIAKAFSEAIVDRTSPFERSFSKAHFRRTFAEGLLEENQRLSETDFEVLVKFLSRDKHILATDGNTIKIRNSAEDATVTEEDSAIASLKELMEDLTRQTKILNHRIDELNLAAQDAVRRKNRVAALASLKSKKQAEANLSRRHATLSQLEDVAAKIEQAADNVQLVKVMQSSTVALRNLNAQVGGADKVDEVLDNLREQMGEVDEVGNVIAEVGPGATIDETEVDDEFEAMLAEERKKDEETERIKREAQEERESEETRLRLAELEKLGPLPVPSQMTEKDTRPITPVTTTANELGDMHIKNDNGAQKIAQKAE
ncbi:Snf7-domain-containing protein [Annulohypoxylon maeteangense]|uniref:Snf7-domain-containing protein n=1 Tax=Annulohypoxylon maeteangense TaxID=1927788 RepID=UPI0020085E61|nr:Snf7-domain-containing protein [Annulohypoxylon maeteangense]KAI0889523.1 Snf7-domain-containing protein [Annulohypoxylon maeteangense]